MKITSSIVKGKSVNTVVTFPLIWQSDLALIGKDLQTSYIKNKNLNLSQASTIKIVHKTFLPELKSYLSGMINVLLYDLSMNYHRRDLTCDGTCLIGIDNAFIQQKTITLTSYDDFLYVETGENYLSPKQLTITSASGGLVKITSYDRKSYGGIPRNTFHGSLIFKQNPVKDLASGSAIENRFIIINRLLFTDYMK